MVDKQKVLENICYTALVYGRINRKLGVKFSQEQIEKLIFTVLKETDIKYFTNIGKNVYVTNKEKNMRITINSGTYRVITVDKIRGHS